VNVETSRTATIGVIRNADMLTQLTNAARQEIVDSGLATADELVVDPVMTVTPQTAMSEGEPDKWVSVTFRWERIRW
jgi:hypothetical protein